ncbi:MAG: PQQ-dependent sugar dehydrogenase [Bacteroidia bacterium]|jgi:glucose/arabinose dehydrogenase|nr:PQQ-dependent sugar dehydrogenase [Bacteroidia bacterium]
MLTSLLIVASLAVMPQDPAPAAAPTQAPAAAESDIPKITASRIWKEAKLRRPIQLVQRPDNNDLVYIAEQSGRIVELDRSKDPVTTSTWLDYRDPVNDQFNEQGLLSMAFHPKFATDRRVFLYYSAESPMREVLASMKVGDDGKPDPKTATIILEQPSFEWNHNGGTVLFGPDGMLYLSFGDGGSGNDPWGHGQDMNTWLAKVIRIDVDRVEAGQTYSVPADNPFVGQAGIKPEIWASGLRNVWRMSFDRSTGDLWGGDVGQNKWEEIDLILKGKNYGWRPREGRHATRGVKDASDDASRFEEPVAEYDHSEGISVTGGFVYRGAKHPSMQGIYLYGDYQFGTVWGLRYDTKASTMTTDPERLFRKRFCIASFGELNDGTVLMCCTEGGADGPGSVYELAPVDD